MTIAFTMNVCDKKKYFCSEKYKHRCLYKCEPNDQVHRIIARSHVQVDVEQISETRRGYVFKFTQVW